MKKQTTKTKNGKPAQPRRVRRNKIPTTLTEYASLAPNEQEKWNRVVHVIARMRASKTTTLRRAAKEFSVDPRAVVKLGKSGLRKQRNGRYLAKQNDRLLRALVIPASNGLQEVGVRDSAVASKIARYSDAVQKYLRTGDDSKLKRFRRTKLKDANGQPIRLMIDIAELTRLGQAGVLSFESLYAGSR